MDNKGYYDLKIIIRKRNITRYMYLDVRLLSAKVIGLLFYAAQPPHLALLLSKLTP